LFQPPPIDNTVISFFDVRGGAQRDLVESLDIDFWNNPHVFDKRDADQSAYHARLRADCRPEVGCMTAGWMGW
jgi:hypothetical protein